MSDSDAEFALRLLNEVSGPARAARQALKGLRSEIDALQRAGRKETPELKRMRDLRSQIRNVRDQEADRVRAVRQSHAVEAARVKEASRQASELKKHQADQFQEAQGLANLRRGYFNVEALGMAAAIAGVVAFVAALAAAVAMAAKLSGAFISASIDGLKFAQNSRLALKFLIGDEGVAAQQFDAMRKEAVALGLDVDETQGAFQKLLAAQFSIGESKELIRMSSDLQGIGNSAEQTNRALVAITQIKAKGRLQSEELLQLSEANISQQLVFNAIGEQIGTSDVNEIRKQLEGGKITSEIAIPAILAAVKKKTGVEEFGDLGKEAAAKTLAGMQRQLVGAVDNLWINVGTAMEPTVMALSKRLGELLGELRNNPDLKALGGFLLNRFEALGLWVEAEWPAIRSAVVTGFEAVVASVRFAGDAVQAVIDNWGTVKTVLAGVAGILAVVAGVAAMFTGPAWLAVAAVTAIVTGLAWVVGAIGSLIGYIRSAIPEVAAKIHEFATAITAGLVGYIRGAIPEVVAAFTEMGSAGFAAFKATLGISSPSKEMAWAAEMTVRPYVDTVRAGAPMVASATAGLGAAALVGAGEASGGDSVGGGARGTLAPVFHQYFQGATEAEGRRAGSAAAREFILLLEGV